MYLQFDVVLADVSAFLVDGDYHWKQISSNESLASTQRSNASFLPVVDKCGVLVRLQQVDICLRCLEIAFDLICLVLNDID